jgi:hypothetical protein
MPRDEDFDEDGDEFPEDYEDGKAWAEIRLISPTGMESTTTLPQLTEAQGQQINVLIMRLAGNLPVLVLAAGQEY